MAFLEEKQKIDTLEKLIRKGELIQTHIAARKVNVSTKTVLRWIEEGKLKAIKVAGRWYIYKSSMVDLLDEIRAGEFVDNFTIK